MGAVLYQVQNGQKRLIAYASRSLSKSERNYPVHKLEFLALKWAITDKFHEYLYGSEFQVFTDNNPLTYVLTTAKLDATGHRWVAALSNYTFSITYKPGKGHVDADALSRIRWPEAIDIVTQTVHAVCKGVQAPHGKVETLCQGAQAVDALCQDAIFVPPILQTPLGGSKETGGQRKSQKYRCKHTYHCCTKIINICYNYRIPQWQRSPGYQPHSEHDKVPFLVGIYV